MTEGNWLPFIAGGIVVLPTLVLAVFLTLYIATVWRLRKREIVSSMSEQALHRYFETFYPEDLRREGVELDGKALGQEFDRLYSACFGRWKFILPSLFLVLMAAAFWLFTAHSLRPWLTGFLGASSTGPRPSFVLVALAGFAGGYMWTLFFLGRHMQERRLTPSDLYSACIRLVVSIPVALSLTVVLQGPLAEDALPAVAFLFGAFPLGALLTFMRRTASSKMNLQESFDDPERSLTQLQGIERDQNETFAAEGVGTILQLAYSDPVDLTIRTGFSFSYVVDCCSQALAWLCFQEQMAKLRRFGLRGAQEICTFVYELTLETDQDEAVMEEEQAWAEKTLDVIAAELSMDRVALRRTLDGIAYDPYTQFLYDVWQTSWN